MLCHVPQSTPRLQVTLTLASSSPVCAYELFSTDSTYRDPVAWEFSCQSASTNEEVALQTISNADHPGTTWASYGTYYLLKPTVTTPLKH